MLVSLLKQRTQPDALAATEGLKVPAGQGEQPPPAP